MSALRCCICRASSATCSSRRRLVSIMASRNTATVRAIWPTSSDRSVLATGVASSPVESEAMRSFRPVSGFTTLRVIIQAIAIEISISTTMTIDAVRTIDQNEVSIAEMYCAVAIIRCQG